MGYKEKMAEGLTAKGNFRAADVRQLIDDIVEVMSKKAAVLSRYDDGDLLLGFAMSGAQKALNFNVLSSAAAALTKSIDVDLTSNISITETERGTEVKSAIQDASTSQQKLLYFIPVSPKAVLGITTYREFNDHLKAGLQRLDGRAQIAVC